MTTPKVAVIGCGYWGKNLVRVFHELGALGAVCDADPATAKRHGEACGVPCFSSPRALLGQPGIEAWVVAAPAADHADVVSLGLESGLDVFVEKPLALDVADGRRLVDLAKAKGRVLMVGHLLHYHGAVKKLKELISSGEMGRIRYVSSHRLNLGKIRREENILWSFAPHDLSLILSIARELPRAAACQGGAYLHEEIADVTVSTLAFHSGLRAHVFVNWLHPFKEQRLVVVGEKKMAVFDDMEKVDKLVLYPHSIDWKEGMPVPVKAPANPVDFDRTEPLLAECRHFLDCVAQRKAPLTDGEEGLRVLTLLDALQRSLNAGGAPVACAKEQAPSHFVHPTAVVDEPATLGEGVKIWHFTHVSKGAVIGAGSNIGQNVFIGAGVRIGKNVKLQNNVSVYEGVELGDDVFCGPSMVFTNVLTPRSHVNRRGEFALTRVGRGATLGANSTVVCGRDVGEYAFVGAGAVVTKTVPPHALVAGNPARRIGWVCACGERLPNSLACARCGSTYEEKNGRLERSNEN